MTVRRKLGIAFRLTVLLAPVFLLVGGLCWLVGSWVAPTGRLPLHSAPLMNAQGVLRPQEAQRLTQSLARFNQTLQAHAQLMVVRHPLSEAAHAQAESWLASQPSRSLLIIWVADDPARSEILLGDPFQDLSLPKNLFVDFSVVHGPEAILTFISQYYGSTAQLPRAVLSVPH
jgi:hypothetical protein